MADPTPRQQLWYGILLLVIGAALALSVATGASGWEVPPLVAYCVAAAFLCAGVTLLLTRAGRTRAATITIALFAAALAAVGGWIGFGPGERSCTANGMGLGGMPCRIVFGGGALVTAAFVILVLRTLRNGGGR